MTNVQKQCLLKYLGYYDGAVDGNFGPLSKMATAGFQDDYGLDPDGEFGSLTEAKILEAVAGTAKPVNAENFWDGIKYFKREEFRCKCGGEYCDGFPSEPSSKLVSLADRIRDHYGVPMIVSSGTSYFSSYSSMMASSLMMKARRTLSPRDSGPKIIWSASAR